MSDLLTTDEAAALLGVSPRTLEAWRVQDPPKGPEFIRIEGQVRYPRESLADYLTASFNKPALPRARAAHFASTAGLRGREPTQPDLNPWLSILPQQEESTI